MEEWLRQPGQVVYFSPANIQASAVPPDIQITSFKVYDHSLLIDSILSVNSTVELNHTKFYYNWLYFT